MVFICRRDTVGTMEEGTVSAASGINARIYKRKKDDVNFLPVREGKSGNGVENWVNCGRGGGGRGAAYATFWHYC